MPRLTVLAGAALGSLLVAGFVQPPVLELGDNRAQTARSLPVSTDSIESLSVTDRTGTGRGQVISVLRRPDDSVAALEVAWTGPDAVPGMTIEHAVEFFDYRPDDRQIVVHQSWPDLVTGYRAASASPPPEPPRAGTI